MPTDEERRKTDAIERFLRDEAGVYETQDEVAHRKYVLGEIYALACKWVKSIVGRSKCCLFTSGSYRMGVGGPGADIDALIVTPREIKREQFFADWTRMLQERSEYVEKAVAVPGAFVPIIKCVWRGVDIDLLFATMDRKAITPHLDPGAPDDRALEYVHDEPSVRSLNGVRVADRVLRLVPSVPVFRVVLRFIKYWAKRRGIYSNAIGYLGGVAWAILLARVSQLFPNACAYTLLRQFFRIMTQWSWPNPVLLCEPSDAAARLNNGAAVSMAQWDASSNYRDRKHLMPILTPAFPSQNCTYNVGQSTFRAITQEIKRASLLVEEMDATNVMMWNVLCAPSSFFNEYKLFLRIDAFVSEPEPEPEPKKAKTESNKMKADTTAASGDDVDDDDPFSFINSVGGTAVRTHNGDAGGDGTGVNRAERMQRLLTVGIADMDDYMIDEQRETVTEAPVDVVVTAQQKQQQQERQTVVDKRKETVSLTEYERDAWFGWVESRLRFLTGCLEYTLHIDYVRPFPKPFSVEDPNTRSYFFGLKFAPKNKVIGHKTRVNLQPAVKDFLRRVDANRETPLVGCRVTHVRRKDLPTWATVSSIKPDSDGAGSDSNHKISSDGGSSSSSSSHNGRKNNATAKAVIDKEQPDTPIASGRKRPHNTVE